MKKMRLFNLLLIGVLFLSTACTSEQILSTTNTILTGGGVALTEGEASQGLRQALIQGITKGVSSASAKGGFNSNSLIKIPFPPDAIKVANTLRDIGLGGEVDKFVTTLNEGAEDAATAAKPIFVSAIKQLTIQDAFNILKGDSKTAATDFLKRATSTQLKAAFLPKISASLDKVNATKSYTNLVNRYNKLPLVQKVNPDLKDYATELAMDGLFKLVAKEEQNIRANPMARGSELLKKVFSTQD
ncbi:MAG: hypothetical protein ACI85I_002741 [Arenicella sp.]|jgi:hypothetical protein